MVKLRARITQWFKKSASWDQPEFPPLTRAIGGLFVQLIILSVTVGLTVFLAPKVNQQFEIERRQSAFYETALSTLSGDAKDLLADLTVYLDSSQKPDDQHRNRVRIKQKITRLIWQRIEFALIFPNDREVSRIMAEYNSALVRLSELIELPRTDETSEEILKSTRDFGKAASDMMALLARRARVA